MFFKRKRDDSTHEAIVENDSQTMDFSWRGDFKRGAFLVRKNLFTFILSILLFSSSLIFLSLGVGIKYNIIDKMCEIYDSYQLQSFSIDLNYGLRDDESEFTLHQDFLDEVEKSADIYRPDSFHLDFEETIPLFRDNLAKENKKHYKYSSIPSCYGEPGLQSLAVDDDFLKKSGFSLSSGVLPKEENDIALSLYAFKTLQDYGFVDALDSTYVLYPDNLITEESILNHYFQGVDTESKEVKYYRLTGFIDTNFEEETLGKFINTESNYNENTRLPNSILESLDRGSLHSCVFVPKKEKGIDKYSERKIHSRKLSYKNDDSFQYGYFPSHEHTLFFEEGKQTTQENEVLISMDGYLSLLEASLRETSRKHVYAPGEIYSDIYQEHPLSYTYSNRDDVYNVYIPDSAIHAIAFGHYKEFKDAETFKNFYENKDVEKYGKNQNHNLYITSYDPLTYEYPWETNFDYELTSEDEMELFECLQIYLYHVYSRDIKEDSYYQPLKEKISTLTQEFDSSTPVDNYGLYQELSEFETYFDARYCSLFAQDFYDQYHDDPLYASIYRSIPTNDGTFRTLRALIQNGAIPEVMDHYRAYKFEQVKQKFQGKYALIELEDRFYTYDTMKNLKIVGIDFDLPNKSFLSMTEQCFQYYSGYNSSYNDGFDSFELIIVPKKDTDIRTIFELIKSYDDMENENGYIHVYYTDYVFSGMQYRYYETFRIWLIVFSAVLMVLSFIMLGLFGYFSRKENRQELLLLKEEGANKKNIRRAFGFVNLIMLAIILHISLIGTWIASTCFIDSTRDNLYYGTGFMVQSWWIYFLIIGLASLFVLISYSILMLHSKKMMRERS